MLILLGVACPRVVLPPAAPSANIPVNQLGTRSIEFSTPKKSAHYESNAPTHGSVLPVVPVNVVIDFNFDLAPPSSIEILKDGKNYGIGTAVIDSNKLSVRIPMEQGAPDGLYTVNYQACWPDRSCHEGHFQFVIDRTQLINFLDLRGMSEVNVIMSGLSFTPQNIRISKGTKVVWKNNDEVEHFVNTDSHPSHTYFVPQNSRSMKKGDTYSTVFETSGLYPYHCSAHADIMPGTIVVE